MEPRPYAPKASWSLEGAVTLGLSLPCRDVADRQYLLAAPVGTPQVSLAGPPPSHRPAFWNLGQQPPPRPHSLPGQDQ